MEIDYSIYYARWNDESDEHYRRTAEWYGSLLRSVTSATEANANILDVGCGTGLLVNALLTEGFKRVRGIDSSPQQIEVATRKSLPCACVDLEYIYRLADETPSSFDLIFLMDVLEHVPVADHMRFIDALYRLLEVHGRLVISVPNANSTFGMRWRYNDWTHQTSFTEHSLEFVALNRGFKRVEFLPFEYSMPLRFPYLHQPSFWTRLLRLFTRALRRLEAIGELGRQGIGVPLALNLMAVCHKSG